MEPEHLVGFGIDMEEPRQPDVVVVNDGRRVPDDIVNEILRTLGETM